MHLDEERVQRLLHDELAWTEVNPVREHVAQCADCRARLDLARREEDEVDALLRHLDHPAAPVTARTPSPRTGVSSRSRRFCVDFTFRNRFIATLTSHPPGVSGTAPRR